MTGGTNYKPGDIVNGHILGGDNRWHPLPLPRVPPREPGMGKGLKIALGVVGGIIAIGVLGSLAGPPAEEQPAAAEPSSAPYPWEDQDSDGDGIPNGEDDAPWEYNAATRYSLCQQLDDGALTTADHTTGETTKSVFRAKVEENCPEHLAAFDAAIAAPLEEQPQSTAPEPQAAQQPPAAQPAPAAPQPPAPPTTTTSQQQAVSSAQDYLRYSSFSRSGLISQLEYEGFSTADATYAVDTVNPDWNQQALGSARDYLEYSGFSRSGLISQLEYEGFTNSQAVYGTDAAGADWNAEAAESAQDYLRYSSFSRQGLIDQLLYEGFTQAQAEYGVGTTGL